MSVNIRSKSMPVFMGFTQPLHKAASHFVN